MRLSHHRGRQIAFTLIELLVVIGIMAVLISLLLPALSRARKSAMATRMQADARLPVAGQVAQAAADLSSEAARGSPLPHLSPANIHSFEAAVDLTPRLSVGTAEPESIYEAKLTARLLATAAITNSAYGEAEVSLPLPPQVISLADLTVKVNGEPSDDVRAVDGALLWHGKLPAGSAEPALFELTYSAVGKGLYTLQTPAGRILDKFGLTLTANGSDVRMLELSMQPTSLARDASKTVYTWNYKRLMFGRPISLDVLGIAPIDRLGELSWLGPLSVVLFGILIGLVGRAYSVADFDRWVLLLLVGAFTGTYPLMYFAQQFIPLKWAILIPAAVTLQIIGWRALTILGPRLAAFGVVLPAAAALALSLSAAVQPNLQGILLTAGGIIFFITAMVLLPKIHFETPHTSGPSIVPAV